MRFIQCYTMLQTQTTAIIELYAIIWIQWIIAEQLLILQGVALGDVVQGGHREAIAACTENMGLGLRGSNEQTMVGGLEHEIYFPQQLG